MFANVGRPTDAESSRAAYAFALFGTPRAEQLSASEARAAKSLLTSVAMLQRTSPRFPVVLLASPEWQAVAALMRRLEQLCVTPIHPPSIGQPRCTGKKLRWETLSLTYGKLGIWGLEQYASVLILDLDVAVVRNLDHVLLYMLRNPEVTELRSPAGCQAQPRWPAASSPSRGSCLEENRGLGACFNTGVWAVRPNNEAYGSLVRFLAGGSYPCGNGDQAAAHWFAWDRACERWAGADCVNATWRGLPHTYNLKYVCLGGRHWSGALPETADSDVHVVHWSGADKAPDLAGRGSGTQTKSVAATAILQATRAYADAYANTSLSEPSYKVAAGPCMGGSPLELAVASSRFSVQQPPPPPPPRMLRLDTRVAIDRRTGLPVCRPHRPGSYGAKLVDRVGCVIEAHCGEPHGSCALQVHSHACGDTRLQWRWCTRLRHVWRACPNASFAHFALHDNPTINWGDAVLPVAGRALFEYFLGHPTHSNMTPWHLFPAKSLTTNAIVELINTQALGTMVGGGGLIYFASKSSQHVYSGWQWKARKEHLAAMTVPIYTMGVGYNAFENQSPVHENPDFRSAFEDNWARFLERSSVVGLRESYSIDKMKALFPSPRNKKIRYQPCATTLISWVAPQWRNTRVRDPSHKVLSINIAADRLESRLGATWSSGPQTASSRRKRKDGDPLMEVLKRWVAAARARGWTVYNAMQGDLDLIVPGVPVKRFAGVNDTLDFYANVTVAASMRGHGVMIPFGLGTPTISLHTHDKVRSFLKDIGHDEWGVEVTHSDPTTLATQLNATLEYIDSNRGKIADEIDAAQAALARHTQANMEVEVETVLETARARGCLA